MTDIKLSHGAMVCPHGLSAWQCENYLHTMVSGLTLCQSKARRKADDGYAGMDTGECRGYKVDKRFIHKKIKRKGN